MGGEKKASGRKEDAAPLLMMRTLRCLGPAVAASLTGVLFSSSLSSHTSKLSVVTVPSSRCKEVDDVLQAQTRLAAAKNASLFVFVTGEKEDGVSWCWDCTQGKNHLPSRQQACFIRLVLCATADPVLSEALNDLSTPAIVVECEVDLKT